MAANQVLGALEIQLLADMARLRQDMNDAKSVVGESMQSIKSAVDLAKNAFIAFVGIASVGAFANMIRGALEGAAALHDLSQSTGASVEGLSALASVGKLSNTSAEQLAGGMNKLSKNLATADEDSKGAAAALKALGINFDDFQKLSPDQRMVAIAKAMDNFSDGAGKSAAAQALLGKSGAELLPFLHDLAEVGELQAKVTAEQAAQADQFGDNLTKLQASSGAWKKELALGMLPALNETAQAFLDVMNGSGGLRDEVRKLSKDGSIAQWTRDVVTGLTYVADAGEYTWRVIKTGGQYVGALAASAVAAVGGIANAVKLLKGGDVSGAWEALKSGVRESDAAFQAFDEDAARTFGAATFGQRLRDRIGELQSMGKTGEKLKPQIDLKPTLAGNDDAMRKLLDTYAKLADAGALKVQEQQNELDTGRKLTDAEKDYVKVMADVAAGKVRITDLQAAGTLAKLQANVVQSQENEALKAEAEWLKESAKQNEAAQDATLKRTDALRQQLAKDQEANATLGLSARQLADHQAALLRDEAAALDRLAVEKDLVDWTGKAGDELREQAALLRARADEAQKNGIAKEAQEAAKEWQKTTDLINDRMTDALMRAFESGKGFLSAFRDVLVNTFKTMVLQPTIKAVLAPVSAAMGALFGGPAQAATGSGGGLGGVSSWFSNFGGSVSGGVDQLAVALSKMGFKDSAQWLAGNSGSIGQIAGMAGNALGYLNAFSQLTKGNYGAAAGSAIGTWFGGPIGGAIGNMLGSAVDKMFTGGAGTPHVGSVVGTTASGQRTLYGDPSQILSHYDSSTDQALRTLGAASTGLLNTVAGAFGGAQNFATILKFAADGHDASVGSLGIGRNTGTFYGNNSQWVRQFGLVGDYNKYSSDPKAAFSAYTADVVSATKAALTAINLPKWARDQFEALGSDTTIDQLSSTAQAVASMQAGLQDLQAGVAPLGGVFTRVAGLSSDALFQLQQFAGGIDAFRQQVAGFVANYYSKDEQNAIAAAGISKTLAGVGIDASGLTTRDSFRALVDGTDVSTEAGRKRLAALLGVQGSFAGLADALGGNTLGSLAALAPASGTLANLLTDQGTANDTATPLLQGAVDQLTTISSGIGALIRVTQDAAQQTVARLDDIAASSQAAVDIARQDDLARVGGGA